LPALERFAEVEAELRDSGNRINEMLGSFPLAIAYPFGAYDTVVVATAKRVGYKFGLTVNQDWYYPEVDKPFTIPRTGLVNEIWPKTLSRINGSFQLLKQLIHKQPNPSKMTFASTHMLFSAGPIFSEMLEACT
jgi:peptidoglycan/xylan/chitin deacetylase (PgdA/CDA1 family)